MNVAASWSWGDWKKNLGKHGPGRSGQYRNKTSHGHSGENGRVKRWNATVFTGLEIEYIEGQTPIDEDEKEGLRIRTISTRGELYEFEQKNIEQAIAWAMRKKFSKKLIFDGTSSW
jgi:RecA-family ATPase